MGALYGEYGATNETGVSPFLPSGGTAGANDYDDSATNNDDVSGMYLDTAALPSGGSAGARTSGNGGIIGTAGPAPLPSGGTAGAK